MEMPGLDTVLNNLLGVGGGAVTVGWLAKILIKKFIADNDEKHETATKAIESMKAAQKKAYQNHSDKLTILMTDLAVIKSRMGEVMTLHDDTRQNGKDIAVALEKIENNGKDINRGFTAHRNQIFHMDQEITGLKLKLSGER